MNIAVASFRVSVLLAALGLFALGCGKKEDPQAVPVPSSSAGGEQAAAAAAAAATATATTPPPQPVHTVTTPTRIESIDACCSALSAVAKSGKSAIAKSKAASAAAVCPGIARLVRSGQTSRAAALTQIKSALIGTTPPAECN